MADISVSMGLNNTQFNSALNQSQQQVTQFSNLTQQQLNQLNGHFEKLKGLIAGVGFANLIKEAANLSSEIVKVSNATGLSTASVKGWSDALVAAGGEADNTRDALLDLNNKISEAVVGGGSLLDAFNKVGVSLSDLQSKSQQDILTSVVKGLSDTKDGATRTSLAMQLMGEDVKTVDFRQVNEQLGEFTNRAKQFAPALEDAKKSQDEFNKTYNKFLEQVTVAVPWNDLADGLKSIGDNIEPLTKLVKIIAELGAVFLVATQITRPYTRLFSVFSTGLSYAGAGVGALALAMGGLRAIWAVMATQAATTRLIFTNLGTSIGALVTGVGVFGVVARGVFTGIIALASRLFVLFAGLAALNNIVASITGFDAIDKITGLFSDNTDKVKENEDAIKGSTRALDEKDGANKRESQFLTDQIKSMNDLVSAYREQNNQILKGIENETNLIGLGDEQTKVQTTLNQLKDAHISKQDELNKKISEGGDPSVIASYQSALEQVNTAYNEQKVAIEAALQAQIEKARADREETFAQGELANAIQRINDLNHESSNLFLPLIEQKYKDIEYAANKAAEAELLAEANRRGLSVEQLPGDYVSKIRDAANAKVQAEKDAVTSNEKAIELKNLELFKTDSLAESQKKIKDIQDGMAIETLPAIQRISAQITKDAEDRAIAEIKSEEARRGSSLSDSEKADYLKKAKSGTEELIKAQTESYNKSREWSTGWSKAMNKYVEETTNAATQAETIFNNLVKGMEDLIVGFVKTGKFAWKDFASSMLEEILRIQLRNTFSNILTGITSDTKNATNNTGSSSNVSGGLSGLFGGLFGGSSSSNTSSSSSNSGLFGGISGIFDSISSAFSGLFADGGSIGVGKWGIAGESGPEVIQGPASITPLSKLPNTAPSVTNVNYTINAVDSQSFKQMIARDPAFIHAVATQGGKSILTRR